MNSQVSLSSMSNSSTSSRDSNRSECFICNEEKIEPILSLMDYEIDKTCGCAAKLHSECYSRWLMNNSTCPVCRMPLINPLQRVENGQASASENTANDGFDHYYIDIPPRGQGHNRQIIETQEVGRKTCTLVDFLIFVVVAGCIISSVILFSKL